MHHSFYDCLPVEYSVFKLWLWHWHTVLRNTWAMVQCAFFFLFVSKVVDFKPATDTLYSKLWNSGKKISKTSFPKFVIKLLVSMLLHLSTPILLLSFWDQRLIWEMELLKCWWDLELKPPAEGFSPPTPHNCNFFLALLCVSSLNHFNRYRGVKTRRTFALSDENEIRNHDFNVSKYSGTIIAVFCLLAHREDRVKPRKTWVRTACLRADTWIWDLPIKCQEW